MKPQICFIVSSETTVVAFLLDHLRELSKCFRLSVVANTTDLEFLAPFGIAAEVIPLKINRKISPLGDIQALFQLYLLFRDRRFEAIHSVSPKAGMLAMVAGALAGIPIRTHTFTGQVWATKRGIMRMLLKKADQLLAMAATNLLADGHSQRSFLIKEGISRAGHISVLAEGSISGVDLTRFQPDDEGREAVRKELGIPRKAFVLLYVGRMNTDKGVLDLAKSFSRFGASRRDAYLVWVGSDEEQLVPRIQALCAGVEGQLRLVGFSPRPERFMAAADVLCLPSYREGFGNVVIEAAAAGIPAMASRIYGLADAVLDRETGLLHDPGDVPGIVASMVELAEYPEFRLRLGQQARQRVLRFFSKETVTHAILVYYQTLLPD